MFILDDISEVVIATTETVRAVIERINATKHLAQIVIDANGRVVGMVTDGDVRRAFVAGATLESPVTDCMHSNPLTAPDAESAIRIISELTGRRRFVPVVDSTGRMVQAVSDAPEPPGLDTAVVMAGGFGKRLGGKTRDTPKPLLDVAGRPIIWHIVKDLEEHGIKQAYITLHYLGEKIRDFLESSNFQIELHFVSEKEPLGTAGGLGFLPPSVDGPVLILNGDIVTRADYRALMVHHQINRRDATVGSVQYDSEIPFGVLETDENGKVAGIQEKPRSTHHVSAGIYLFEPQVYRLVEAGVHLDMPDLLRRAIAANFDVGLFPIHEYWMDLGRPSDLRRAELDLLKNMDGTLRQA